MPWRTPEASDMSGDSRRPYSARGHLLTLAISLYFVPVCYAAAYLAPTVTLTWWFAGSGIVVAGFAGYYIATYALRLDPRDLRPAVRRDAAPARD